MTKTEFKRNFSDVKALFSEEKNVLKKILREVMQEILEQEMTDSFATPLCMFPTPGSGVFHGKISVLSMKK